MQEGMEHEPSLTALFTFVARDPVSRRAMAINQLVPQTPEDVTAFAERQQIADSRKAARRLHLEAGDAGTLQHPTCADTGSNRAD